MLAAAIVLATVLFQSRPTIPQERGSQGRSGNAGVRTGSTPKIAADEPVATFEGTVSGVERKKILVDDAEGNTMDFYLTKKTRLFDGEKEIKSSGLKTGDHVRVEAQRHRDGTVDAVNVRTTKAPAVKP